MEKGIFESLGEVFTSQKWFFEELKSVKESITVFLNQTVKRIPEVKTDRYRRWVGTLALAAAALGENCQEYSCVR